MIRETQTFLNYFLDNVLVNDKNTHTTKGVDGIQGVRTNNAITQALLKLKEKFKKENLKWNDKFNFIGIRTDNDLDNSFDDWFLLVVDGTLIACPASTVSGTPGIIKYWNRRINNRTGVGTIAENQQIDYLLVTPKNKKHWNWSWTGAGGFLFQDNAIRLYRGAVQLKGIWHINKNNPIPNSMGGGFNVHSWIGWVWSIVNNLSEGCQVCTEKYWKVIFPLLIKYSKNDRVIYTILQW